MQPRLYAVQLRVMVVAELAKWAKNLQRVLPPAIMQMVEEASESFMSGADGDDFGDFPIIGPCPHKPDAA